MSKPVRISDDLAARIGIEAQTDRRSFANMVEVLLLSALERRASTIAVRHVVSPIAPRAAEPVAVPSGVHDGGVMDLARDLALRDGRCGADVARGTKCKLCGKEH